ncbi:MAG: hypothetical protein ACC657_10305 [Thiohalomonadales bacterium]
MSIGKFFILAILLPMATIYLTLALKEQNNQVIEVDADNHLFMESEKLSLIENNLSQEEDELSAELSDSFSSIEQVIKNKKNNSTANNDKGHTIKIDTQFNNSKIITMNTDITNKEKNETNELEQITKVSEPQVLSRSNKSVNEVTKIPAKINNGHKITSQSSYENKSKKSRKYAKITNNVSKPAKKPEVMFKKQVISKSQHSVIKHKTSLSTLKYSNFGDVFDDDPSDQADVDNYDLDPSVSETDDTDDGDIF